MLVRQGPRRQIGSKNKNEAYRLLANFGFPIENPLISFGHRRNGRAACNNKMLELTPAKPNSSIGYRFGCLSLQNHVIDPSIDTFFKLHLSIDPCRSGFEARAKAGHLDSRLNRHRRAQQPQHREPLSNRVAVSYSAPRAVCPAHGDWRHLPAGAARAERPFGRGFLWSGALRAPSGAPFPVGGTPIVARPATRIGVRMAGLLTGVRP